MDDEARVARLADVLLPGDDLFPPASRTGMTPLLTARLRAADGDLLANLPDATPEAVTRLAAEQPELFDSIRKIVFVTYYEAEQVVAAIRALGMPYNDIPLPAGYPPEPFNPATDTPRHQRGHWRETADIKPLDLSTLDHLGASR